MSSPALAATLYVAPNGHDANAGTLTAPLATPGRAVALASAGDTILLRAGSYPITASLQITQPGLTLASYPGERARIVGGTDDLVNLTSIVVVYASRVTIQGLELEGASFYGVKLDEWYGPQSGQRLRGLYIHHTGRDGIKVQQADGVVIEDCEIGFTGVRDASNAEGIDLMSTIGGLIRRNYIHDTATNGLFVKGGSRNIVVEANRVERTGYSGILLGSESDAEFMRDGVSHEAIDSVARNNIVVDAAYSGLGSIAGDNIRFENNTVINAARVGQAMFRAVPNQYNTPTRGLVLYNNVFVLTPSSSRPMVHLYDYSGPIETDANIWYSIDGRYQYWSESSSGANHYWTSLSQWRSGMNVDWTSQAVDPRLDASSLYRPLDGSPAIDRGITTGNVTTDYSGILRPEGAAYDIGAHERSSTVPPPTEPPPTEPPPTEPPPTEPPPTEPPPVDPPPAPVVPSAPGSLTAVQSSRTAITLTWVDASGNEDGFRIEQSINGGAFTVIATVSAGSQSRSVNGVKRNKTYTFRVAAYNAAGVSGYSNTASVTIAR